MQINMCGHVYCRNLQKAESDMQINLCGRVYCRNLQKAESRMEKLSKALSEVDRKVEGLKGKFERTTMEAAKLKVELEKAQETIDAAENLVGKLEGEYRRWSGQVGGVFKK